jgi:predicted DNA-binding protein with PD1-like motif
MEMACEHLWSGPGDDVNEELLSFAHEQDIWAASFSGIGTLQHVMLGHFPLDQRQCRLTVLDGEVEVLMLAGNITRRKEGPGIHAHIVVSGSDASAHAGYLLEGIVGPVLGLVVTETPRDLRRVFGMATSLNLLVLKES